MMRLLGPGQRGRATILHVRCYHVTMFNPDRKDAIRESNQTYVSNVLKTLPQHIQPEVWIRGHVHASYDAKSGRTCVVCNPVKGGKFNPHLILGV